MRRANIPTFTIHGVEWHCYDEDGAYIWLSTCSRGKVSRPSGFGGPVTVEVDDQVRKRPNLLVAIADASEFISKREAS